MLKMHAIRCSATTDHASHSCLEAVEVWTDSIKAFWLSGADVVKLPGHELKHKAGWAEAGSPVGIPKADIKALRTCMIARAKQSPSCTGNTPPVKPMQLELVANCSWLSWLLNAHCHSAGC